MVEKHNIIHKRGEYYGNDSNKLYYCSNIMDTFHIFTIMDTTHFIKC